MTSTYVAALVITVEGGFYEPLEVRLGGELIGWRPRSGASREEVAAEVAGALAGLLGERLGWPQTEDGEDLGA